MVIGTIKQGAHEMSKFIWYAKVWEAHKARTDTSDLNAESIVLEACKRLFGPAGIW